MAAHFKGTVFESARLFTERQFGPDAVDRVLSSLSDEDRQVLAAVSTISWCPVEPVLRYHHAMDRLCGTGDLSTCFQAGRFSASWAMSTVLKLFLRFRSPVWLIERATSVWGRYHDTGRWEIHASGDRRMQGTLHDFAVRDPAFCARLRGWLLGAVEITGGKRATVSESRCVCRGHDACTFAVVWQD